MLMFTGPQLHLKKRIKQANEEKQINPFILYSKFKKMLQRALMFFLK